MTDTVRMEIAQLKDTPLRWAFSRALGREDPVYRHDETGEILYIGGPDRMGPIRPDLSRLVETRRLHICPLTYDDKPMFEVWIDGTRREDTGALGTTAVSAAMRCIVRAHFGETADVPQDVVDHGRAESFDDATLDRPAADRCRG